MVVGPEELKEITPEDELVIKSLEKKIDKALKEKDERGYNLTVSIEGVETNSKIKQKIEQMYLNAGWKKVIFHAEQFGGDWIEFIEKEY